MLSHPLVARKLEGVADLDCREAARGKLRCVRCVARVSSGQQSCLVILLVTRIKRRLSASTKAALPTAEMVRLRLEREPADFRGDVCVCVLARRATHEGLATRVANARHLLFQSCGM